MYSRLRSRTQINTRRRAFFSFENSSILKPYHNTSGGHAWLGKKLIIARRMFAKIYFDETDGAELSPESNEKVFRRNYEHAECR